MTDYDSMGIGPEGLHQDRSCDNMGFSIDQHGVSSAQTAYHSLGTDRGSIPGELPSPLVNATVPTNNTQLIDVGPTASDIVRRQNA